MRASQLAGPRGRPVVVSYVVGYLTSSRAGAPGREIDRLVALAPWLCVLPLSRSGNDGRNHP